jgi:hypothetical protein
MFVLFDQGTPIPIRTFLKEHTVQTTSQRGWDELKNGELLKASEEAGFEVFLTPDKNIRYQQIWRFAQSQSSCSAIRNGLCCDSMWTG